MKAAEKKCGNKKGKGMFWYSTTLKFAAQKLSDAKKWLRCLQTREGIQEEISVTKKERDAAITKLREVQQNDRQYHDEMLEDLANKKAKPWNMSVTSALKVLKEAEKYSQIFSKVNVTRMLQ